MTIARFIPYQPPQAKYATPLDVWMSQGAVARVLDKLTSKAQLDSYVLGSLALTAGVENWVEHGLGHSIRGWTITDIDTPALVYRVTSSTADVAKFLVLATSANVTVDVMVF